MDNINLSDFFKTKSEAEDFSMRLSSISEKIYEANFNLESALLEGVEIEKKDKFLNILKQTGVNLKSPPDLSDLFDKIQEKISSLPVLSITLAFEPGEQTLRSLSEWFLLNVKRQVILDIKVDSSLIAGAAILMNGHYLDFSIRSRFDQVLKGAFDNGKHQEVVTTMSKTPPTGTLQQSTEHITFGR